LKYWLKRRTVATSAEAKLPQLPHGTLTTCYRIVMEAHTRLTNYLPAHSLCNNYRWDYSAEEFQWVLKIGVWARRRMESGSTRGTELAIGFYEHEVRNYKRRKNTN
jgi:hypothetical protein